MSRITLLFTVAIWSVAGLAVAGIAVAGIAVIGCGDGTQDEQSGAYVSCRATLREFTKDYAWFEDGSAGHDDGVAPLASFVLIEPSTQKDRAIAILFKFSPDATTASPPNADDIGHQFTVQVPADFLAGTAAVIDNASVREFRKVEP